MKVKRYLMTAALATAAIVPATAYAGNASMICTDPTGKDYTATYSGNTVVLKNAEWSAKLTVTSDDALGTIITKTNAKGVYTNISFGEKMPLINYFRVKGGLAYQQDQCRNVVLNGKAPAVARAEQRQSNELFQIERFFETEGGSSKAILSVTVPAASRYVDGQCAFKDGAGNVLDVSSVIALHSGYETVYGPSAATAVNCKLAARF